MTIEQQYDAAFPRRITAEPGDPDWLRTPHAAACVARDGRVDVELAHTDPGPIGPRSQLGPKYARAYARARHEAGYTDVLVTVL